MASPYQNVTDSKMKDFNVVVKNMLSSNTTTLKSPKNLTLTECSPEVDVIYMGNGGICTTCRTMFKSMVSLNPHLKRCKKITN